MVLVSPLARRNNGGWARDQGAKLQNPGLDNQTRYKYIPVMLGQNIHVLDGLITESQTLHLTFGAHVKEEKPPLSPRNQPIRIL